MGRSTTSCFKIITCASDSVDRDDLEAPESKASTDKRGWSFRKRSTRHRVLSNSVISEAPSSVNKDIPESANVDFETQTKSANIDFEAQAKSANVNFETQTKSANIDFEAQAKSANIDFETQAKSANVDFGTQSKSANVDFETQATSAIPGKSSGMEWTDEVPQLLTSINSKYSEAGDVGEADTKFDVKPDESVIIVIQAAIRRFLAEKQLMKHKNIVKLQATVRGHLVRRHAVGSLRCVQAIIKMQALVRARHTRLSDERSTWKDNHPPKIQGKQKSGAKSDVAYTSIEKLLSNRFARQLLESSPRTKSINIKCDPSRSDSAWKWLERWVSSSPIDTERAHKPDPITNLQEQDKVNHNENQSATLISSEGDSELTDLRSNTRVAAIPYLKSDAEEAVVPSETEENLITDKVEQPQAENLELSKSTENLDLLPNQNSRSDSVPQMELDSFSGKPELETEQPKRSMKRVATEQPESEGRRFVFGSRKASNPAFIAAQSKFEELTFTNNSAKSINSSNQENEIESYADTVSSAIDNEIRTKEINLVENLVTDTSRVVLAGSECGTELSITSTLDSPDRSVVGAVEFEHEVDILVEGTGNSKNVACLDVETKVEPAIPGTDLSYPITVQSEQPDDANGGVGELFEDAIGVDSSKVEQKLEDNSSDMQTELEHETLRQACKSSPEASPKSHITHGTSSSQVSSKARKTKNDKIGSSQKRKSLSAGKRSPINPSNDSGVRSSLEQIPKDLKTGKRRISFGSAKSNNIDQEEPRDSSSGLSIPSYMQATESARAKAYGNSSLRSSPDVQDKETYIKKRHSLPGANGRQGSPRIQRSMSQAQQSTKGNGTNPPQERKWQR